MKVLVLGNGIHTNKRILPALVNIDSIDEIIVGDRNEKKENINKNIKIVNFDKSLDNEDIFDLTIIATPPYNHLESFEKTKDVSNKVLIEKPLTNNFDYVFGNELKVYLGKKNF